MKPAHLLLAVAIVVALAFVAYQGDERPVVAAESEQPDTTRFVQSETD